MRIHYGFEKWKIAKGEPLQGCHLMKGKFGNLSIFLHSFHVSMSCHFKTLPLSFFGGQRISNNRRIPSVSKGAGGCLQDTPSPETNGRLVPANRPGPNRKTIWYSNHPFSGVNSLFVSGRATQMTCCLRIP